MEQPINVSCPWCGEVFVTFFDSSAGSQDYIEDCQVCCRPIDLSFHLGFDQEVIVEARRS